MPDELKTFNEYILYGDEINFNELLLKANNYPIMGGRQLFLVRDSNNLINGVTNNGSSSGTISWSPTETGTYYYICEFHPSMLGTITITE